MKSVSNRGIKLKKEALGKMLLSTIILAGLAFLCSHYPAETGGGWYHQLKQPVFAPPYWLPFAMWTLVYILMGCSAGILWHNAAQNKDTQLASRAKKGLVLFAIHLIFNLIFPVILIGFHKPVIGMIDLLILLGFIGYMIRYFQPINRLAARLLIPYFIWIVYAGALNAAIIVLN